ncbi:MAG TPA: metalloregulator ArsR/SmtB family transcription factor [Acidimicrobiia bacterium]|nr:metalloregulator ArsR/SmtB family transcription factor [Acidimicrobiia bacterium]
MDGFTALADPTRREIVELLYQGPKDAGTIAGQFPISKPAISRHLSVLRDSGLVAMQKDAQRRVYSLRREGLREVDRWISRYRSFWEERLDDLETALEKEES